jgi:hypothetical protein
MIMKMKGFAPLGFGNVVRIQSIRCDRVTSYFYSVRVYDEVDFLN